jgi:hypothetical protein
MSKIYKILAEEVNQLESIENWSEKVNKMKEIKENIVTEQEKLNELINMILKNDVKKSDNKIKKIDLESIVNSFKTSENLDEKIKYYHLISSHVTEVEKQLFR